MFGLEMYQGYDLDVFYWIEPVSFMGEDYNLLTASVDHDIDRMVVYCALRKPVPPNYAIIGFGQGHEEYLAELRNSLRHAGTVRLVPDHAANLQTIRQVLEYLDGRRRDFALRLRLFGTEFQQKVWRELLKIPYGVTISYGDIAYAVGNRKGARAVGMANNRNPVSLIVPCHRVIGKNGKLVGYGGGLDIKEKLLSLEKMNAEISVTCTG